MTFVYTGKGKRSAQSDSAPPEQKLCAKQACAIQVRDCRRKVLLLVGSIELSTLIMPCFIILSL